MHYPGKHTNDNKQNDEIFKDKTVINHPAGNIEFINTKDSESVTITHKNGAFVKFDKFGVDELVTRDKREHVLGNSLININGSLTNHIDENSQTVILGDYIETIGDADKWQYPMEQIKRIQRELHDLKRLFEIKRTDNHNSIDQAPNQSKSGSHAACPTHSTQSQIVKTGSVTQVATIPVNSGTILEVNDGSTIYPSVANSSSRCLTCWGKMTSPSTQDGSWDVDKNKQKIIEKRAEVQAKMYEFEKELGQNKCPNGGNYIRTIAKNFVDNIGLVFNDFESFRKDPHGKLVPCGVKIDTLGTTIYTQYRDSSLIEHVDVEKMPGGSYDLNICDGWTATVGSNGIDFKSSGPLNLFGTIVNLTGEQVNVSSRGELTLDAERLDISAETISFSPKTTKKTTGNNAETEEEKQLLIDGNLNVGLNAVIRGGAHIEGELSVHHITAPCEYHITETDFTYGHQTEPSGAGGCLRGQNGSKPTISPDDDLDSLPKSPTYATLLPGALIGQAIWIDPLTGAEQCLDVFSLRSTNFAIVDQHQHYFKGIPTKLFDNPASVNVSAGSASGNGVVDPHDAVRSVGARNNWVKPIPAQPIKNSKSHRTITEKFGGYKGSSVNINKSDWSVASVSDTLPSGEGFRTTNLSDLQLNQKIKEIEKDLETKYNELKETLAILSQQTEC